MSKWLTLLLLASLTCTLFGISNAIDTTVSDHLREKEGKVLTHQDVKYSNPSVNTEYSSSAHFKPKGMEHVYTITHAFLDLVQRKDVLPASINASQILDDHFWEANEETKATQLYKVRVYSRTLLGGGAIVDLCCK